MALATFSCPDCNAVLKTPSAIAAGKRIRCPQCGNSFAIPGPAEAVFADGDGQEEPVAESRRGEDLATFASAQQHSSAGGAPVESAQIRATAPISQRRAPGLTTRLAVAGIFSCVALLAGASYYAWDRLVNSGRNSGSGREQPLAYLPADSSAVVFVDFAALMEQPGFGTRIQQGIALGKGSDFFADCKRETGLEFNDLLSRVTYAFRGADLATNPVPQTIVIESRVPFSQRHIAQSAKGAMAKKLSGKTYYEASNTGFRFLFMPSDRIIVLTNVPEDELASLIGSPGTETMLSAAAAVMAAKARDCHFSLVFPISEPVRRSIRRALGGLAGNAPAGLINAFLHAEAGGLWLKFDGPRVRGTIGLACLDEATAQRDTAEFRSNWPQLRATLSIMAATLGQVTGTAWKEALESAQFSHDQNVAVVTAEMSAELFENIIRASQNGSRTAGGAPTAPVRGVAGPHP